MELISMHALLPYMIYGMMIKLFKQTNTYIYSS